VFRQGDVSTVNRPRIVSAALAWAAIHLTLTGLPVAAQQSDPPQASCKLTTEPERSIAGCTAVLAASNAAPQARSLAYAIRGDAYFQREEYDRAIADNDEAIRLDPQSPFGYLFRSNVFFAKGDFVRAIADLDEVIKLRPDEVLGFSGRGEIYMAKGDIDRALADFDAAMRLNPNVARFHLQRGNAYGARGDLDRAILDFGEAIRLAPNEAAGYVRRATAYSKKGETDRAIADFDRAVERDANIMRWSVTIAQSPSSTSATLIAPSPILACSSNAIRKTPCS
jgi:tetratricopeptide (TPR) repeat protein